MKTFPMFLKMEGRRVVILGGGEQAAQKARLILKTSADVVVAAGDLCPELAEAAERGALRHHSGSLDADLLRDAALVFAASGCAGADAAHAALARTAGALVNVVDAPELCEAFTPSIVDRDPVVVAIGTEGTAPVLGRQIKARIETLLEPQLGALAALAGRLRARVARHVAQTDRRAFWAWVFAGPPRTQTARGDLDGAQAEIEAAITVGRSPDTPESGSVALVGAGPGAADLITLRGVKRLQEADVILHDRLVSADVLELARRDAERIYVGKAPGDACLPDRWSQARINRLIVQLASQGKAVVRLKCGDPGVFARGEEELAACAAAGIPCEVVPGITAASGAMAAAGQTLTERGEVETLTLATGTTRRHAVPRHLARHLQPGSRLAVYMGTGAAPQLQTQLLQNAPADLPVKIVEAATTSAARTVTCHLSTLAQTVTDQRITAPAMIIVSYPRSHAAQTAQASAQ